MYEIHRNDVAVTTGVTDLVGARVWLAWHLDHACAGENRIAEPHHAQSLKTLIPIAVPAAVFTLAGEDFRIVRVGEVLSAPAYAVGLYQIERSWLDDREVGQRRVGIWPARTLRAAEAIRRRLSLRLDHDHQAVHQLCLSAAGVYSRRLYASTSDDTPF
jgi:hypothetical protein